MGADDDRLHAAQVVARTPEASAWANDAVDACKQQLSLSRDAVLARLLGSSTDHAERCRRSLPRLRRDVAQAMMQQPPQGEPRVELPPQGAASAMLACVERWSEELVSSISAATEQRTEELAKAFGRLGEEIAVEVSGLAGRLVEHASERRRAALRGAEAQARRAREGSAQASRAALEGARLTMLERAEEGWRRLEAQREHVQELSEQVSTLRAQLLAATRRTEAVKAEGEEALRMAELGRRALELRLAKSEARQQRKERAAAAAAAAAITGPPPPPPPPSSASAPAAAVGAVGAATPRTVSGEHEAAAAAVEAAVPAKTAREGAPPPRLKLKLKLSPAQELFSRRTAAWSASSASPPPPSVAASSPLFESPSTPSPLTAGVSAGVTSDPAGELRYAAGVTSDPAGGGTWVGGTKVAPPEGDAMQQPPPPPPQWRRRRRRRASAGGAVRDADSREHRSSGGTDHPSGGGSSGGSGRHRRHSQHEPLGPQLLPAQLSFMRDTVATRLAKAERLGHSQPPGQSSSPSLPGVSKRRPVLRPTLSTREQRAAVDRLMIAGVSVEVAPESCGLPRPARVQ
jgi:hypothetical protein